jgi:tRNA/rRNA methyltransferase
MNDSVRFVLVEPQFAGNLGAAARALKNLGFRRLVAVRPACDPQDAQARMMAVDAGDVLGSLVVADTLDEALDGAATVAGLTRRTGKHRRPHYRIDACADSLAALARRGELALVFGREDHGLSDADLDRSTHLVYLPAHEDYPSYNLAQAVLLAAWELHRASLAPEPAPPDGTVLAAHGEREAMYAHLERALESIGYLHDDSVEPIMRRLRRMFGRAELTAPEVALLRGVAQQVLWAAGQAGLTRAKAEGDARGR